MNKANIFIPDTCRVGFQERKDTFTGLLAYVIYYRDGKIRKETSWKSWCKLDSGKPKLDPRDFDNAPTSGFVLNKGIRRYIWSHFSTGRSMIRLYDPRGWEFEITPDNLVMILMHIDCSKREIIGDLVYAWSEGVLVLLPCSSTVYQEARSFSDLQAQKVSALDLSPGATYITKDDRAAVYLGRHIFFKEVDGDDGGNKRVGKKHHIFRLVETGEKPAWYEPYLPITSVPSKIAKIDNPHCHDDYAVWLEEYLADPRCSTIVEWQERPLEDDDWPEQGTDRRYVRGATCFITRPGGGWIRGTAYHAADINAVPFWKRPSELRLCTQEDGNLFFYPYKIVDEDGGWRYYNSRDRPGYPAWPAKPESGRFCDLPFDVIPNPKPGRLIKLTALFENGAKVEW